MTERAPGRGRGPSRGRPTARGADRREGEPRRSRRPEAEPHAERRGRDEPVLPADATPADLDPDSRRELMSLPKSLADTVAAHLVAAGRLVDDDPAAAQAHARYARRLAPRVAAVREAVGVTAYLVGDYAEAARELRAVRRMTGRADHLPLIADAERGMGRPERALELGRDPQVADLDPAVRVELKIVLSGARRDLGEYDAAVVSLQGADLDSETVQPWTTRLWYAYADALLAAGRRDEAASWFHAVAAIDEDRETDAEERLAELEPDA